MKAEAKVTGASILSIGRRTFPVSPITDWVSGRIAPVFEMARGTTKRAPTVNGAGLENPEKAPERRPRPARGARQPR